MDSDQGIATIQTKSRIGRGLAQRRTQKLEDTGNSFNQNNNSFGNSNTNFRNSISKQQDSNAFSNQNVLNLDDNTKSYNIGARANTDHMTEAQIDKHTANITKEIQSLDYQLKNINNNNNSTQPGIQRNSRGFNNSNNNNSYGYNTFGSGNTSNTGQGYTPSFESDANSLGGTGRIRRNRDNSVKQQQQITGNSFNGRSTNTSLNAAYQSDQTLDHFEQQEKQLKQQLLEYEKKQQQQEKVMQLKENAKRNTQSKLNNQGQGDLTIKLSSPTFNNKKGGSITQNQRAQQDSANKFNIYGDNSNEVSEYVPGSMGGSQNKFRGTRSSLGGTQTLKKPPQPKNNDEEVAVATGFQDCPFEDSQQDNQELIQCPEGCGRQFNEKALQKHILVCKKVFQEKKTAKKPPIANNNNRSVSSSKKNKIPPKAGSNLADIKKKLKQQKEAQGGQKDDLINE